MDASRKLQIALYSHDTMGIGHFRRNLLIARALTQSLPNGSILLIAGAREAAAFGLPQGIDCLTLPAFHKESHGAYRARRLRIPLRRLVQLRSEILRAALEAFEPDLLIVDKEPGGVFGELAPALTHLAAEGRTRCVLGLRDVLDDPETVRQQWDAAGNDEMIERFYDAVWIYGDRSVYDPVQEYGFGAAVAARARFTGYLDRSARFDGDQEDELDEAEIENSGRLMLCLVGGGQDGMHLAGAFARARFPPGCRGIIVTGPFMAAEYRRDLKRLCAQRQDLELRGFVTRTESLLRGAERIVAMGGYNTVCEILAFRKPALIVPRVRPRQEQWIRAQRLAQRGLLDVLHPHQVTGQAVGEWLARDLNRGGSAHDKLDFSGLTRLPTLVHEVMTGERRASEIRGPAEGFKHARC